MSGHLYEKTDLVAALDAIKGKSLGEIDNRGIFERVSSHRLQKGIAGHVIERCVFGYPPDSSQEADLVVCDGGVCRNVELKTTGMVLKRNPLRYEAKEPMSITAVGVYELAEQSFRSSHFWRKLERLLIVYYDYDVSMLESGGKPSAYDYRFFKVVDYEFHEFSRDDRAVLAADWQKVHDLVAEVVGRHGNDASPDWKEAVRQDYIAVHRRLRPILLYIDLAPMFPPRFRLKQAFVSVMIAKHFGYEFDRLEARIGGYSDLDGICARLTERHKGKRLEDLADEYRVAHGSVDKALAERVAVAMFGGTAKNLGRIEVFAKLGLVAKTVVLTADGRATESMKLFRIDFSEMAAETFQDVDGERAMEFEDSQLYTYFADRSFLCIVFQEQRRQAGGISVPLKEAAFVGFKRITFSDGFIYGDVRSLWVDTRSKIREGRLVDVLELDARGNVRLSPAGYPKSAPNFMKSAQNRAFIRGSGGKSRPQDKTEVVNGIRMLPQYVWVKGSTIAEMLLSGGSGDAS